MPAQREPTGWPALLDALEASLAGREATIFDGAVPPSAVPLPESLPALRRDELARAHAVLDALAAQEEQLGGELARVRLELARVTRADSGAGRRTREARRGVFEARV